jgi:glycosyltransferase involved in cell wall biosynthesis
LNNKYKIIRVANVPGALSVILNGQLNYINTNPDFELIGVSIPGDELNKLSVQEGIRVKGIRMERGISPIRDFFSIINLYIFLLKEKPFIIHSHTPKAGLVSMIAGFLARVPIRIHTYTGLIFPAKRGFLQKLLIFFDRVICFCATNIYPEGVGVQNDLIKYRITNKTLKVLANGNINGIDTKFFSLEKFNNDEIKKLRTGANFISEDIVFLFVGRIVKDKGVNELVRAFLKINNKYNQSKLLIVGGFEDDINPVSDATKQEILNNNKINYAGFQRDVKPFFAMADVFILPSYREGFPNVVLQAGAMELPSIVTNINGSNEIIQNGLNGLIIESQNEKELYDAMERFILDLNLRINHKQIIRETIIKKYEQKDVWYATIYEYHTVIDQYYSKNKK